MYMVMKSNIILNGDCLTIIKELPDNSINMCMTSPPYWALRDYGVEGQLGLEPTFQEYIRKLCDIFDEVKRVLKKEGTCWVNLGDTYMGNSSYSETGRQGYDGKDGMMNKWKDPKNHASLRAREHVKNTLPPKSLSMIPMRFAIEMVNRGWILRNTIIWHKRNCMPSSVKDRFTVDFEYLFFFSKQKKYYFETQYEPHTTKENRPNGIVREREFGCDTQYPEVRRKKPIDPNNPYKGQGWENSVPGGGARIVRERDPRWLSPDGRNKRTMWSINPKPFSEAHFAVYPEELCETPIKAGCPEFVCVKCGNPKEKVLERGSKKLVHTTEVGKGKDFQGGGIHRAIGQKYSQWMEENPLQDLGYKPTCNCNSSFTSGIVLDPFFGSGTTGVVSLKQNKKFIGIELNPEYIEIAKERLKPYLEQKKLI